MKKILLVFALSITFINVQCSREKSSNKKMHQGDLVGITAKNRII